jgi:hypothetical protein
MSQRAHRDVQPGQPGSHLRAVAADTDQVDVDPLLQQAWIY